MFRDAILSYYRDIKEHVASLLFDRFKNKWLGFKNKWLGAVNRQDAQNGSERNKF